MPSAGSPPPAPAARPCPSTWWRMRWTRTSSRYALDFDGGVRLTNLGIALAAVFHQESKQRLETTDIDAVDDGPALPSGQYQPGVAQLRQVERQRRRRNAQPLRQHTGRQSFRPLLNENPEDGQTMLLRERAQSRNNVLDFHGGHPIRGESSHQEI